MCYLTDSRRDNLTRLSKRKNLYSKIEMSFSFRDEDALKESKCSDAIEIQVKSDEKIFHLFIK